jgi:hypothetical protein
MSSHRRHLRRAALVVTCCALAAPSLASAAKVGDTPADFPGSLASAAKVGDTPADFAQPVAFGGPRAADTRVDFPVAFGGPRATHVPRSLSTIGPERAVVRDAHETLPIVLSSALLLLALCGLGLALVRTRVLRRGLTERAH